MKFKDFLMVVIIFGMIIFLLGIITIGVTKSTTISLVGIGVIAAAGIVAHVKH